MKTHVCMKQRGFSLIEWLLVLALLAYISVSSFQHWSHYQQRERLEITARQLLGFLTRLQADAFWLNRPALLWHSFDDTWCIGSGEQPLQGCQAQDGWLFTPDYSGITLVELTPESLGFYGLRNTAQPGRIILANAAGRIRLVISNHGRIRLCGEKHAQFRIPLC
ncbi:N-terminal cleavage protein [Yersinia entomophaga]|uniref:N-terminal cleavage protein n=2 Tax=Yersiniaceae TaxID=1903411 RepID=A0ABM6BKV3_YERET|nr:N-terminal cleavage protein [Yersinia entomophaga]OWF87442.1 prepilin-type cleavage/methylation domain-containing protein [Yersinia entomophaga]